MAAAATADAGPVLQHLGVGAADACGAGKAVAADCTVVAADGAGALAGVAVRVEPVFADERFAALPTVCSGEAANAP